MSAAAAAQEMDAPAGRPANLPPGAVVQPLDDGASAELRRNLVTLAENPRSISALVGAGRAALEMGDPDAALTFFSRADEAEPRNPRAKAGMAAALVQLEQPQAALTLFQEAMQLGAPEAEIAGDLGLAYDTLGDPAQAQRYYNTALRNRDDPEIRRRLALSLAISGQRDQALRTIDAQLRRNDRAAWRAQAFILALTGDTAGANRAAQSVMPAGGAAAIAPFFARMAALSPAQKALAVHFGHFPSDGRPTALASTTPRVPPPPPPVARARPDAPAATVPDRRQWPTSPLQSAAVTGTGQPRSTLVDALRPRATPPQASAPQSSTPPPAAPPPRPLQRFQPNMPDQQQTAVAASTTPATPGFSLSPGGPQPGPGATPPPAPPVVSVQARPFSEIAAVVNTLPVEERAPAPTVVRPPAGGPPAMTDRQIRDALAREREQASRANPPPARTATAATGTAARPVPRPPAATPRRPTPPANPSRHWVQIAGGANRATLPREFARLRGLAPNLLGNRQAWTTPLNATNRLLVGPFDTPRAAQAFVNQLGQSEISAFAWTSPAGQEIERLQTPR